METIFNTVGKNGKNDASDVKKIQNLLNASSAISKISADGRYGPATQKAILQYQMSIFLQEKAWDGLISPNGNTLRALNNAKTPIMRKVIPAVVDAHTNRSAAHAAAPSAQAHAVPVHIVATDLRIVTSTYKGLSGDRWHREFPTSTSLADLAVPFKGNFDKFWSALVNAGIKPHVTATFRPSQRAWLMHWAYKVAHGHDPRTVPAKAGVNIDWVHLDAKGGYDAQASKKAAGLLNLAYKSVVQPSQTSLHISGNAVDMSLEWSKSISIVDGNNKTVTIPAGNGIGSTALHEVAATYNVIKRKKDGPHWSVNGH